MSERYRSVRVGDEIRSGEDLRVGDEMVTERLHLRRWRPDDAEAAVRIYGDPEIAARLSPAVGAVPDAPAMRSLIEQWIADGDRLPSPCGRWALVRRADGELVGGVALLPLPPGEEDLEFGWQVARTCWGKGYAGEAGRRVARWAFEHGQDEVFAVMRADNTRATAVALRIGMEWVGETDKYYGHTLQIYRLRHGDLRAQEAVDPA